MSSSLSRTPCWGLVCKRWSSDLHPSPDLQNKTYFKFLVFMEFSKLSGEKNQLYTEFPLTFPSPVLISTSTAYTSCTSNSAFSWSFLQKQGDKIIHWLNTESGQWQDALDEWTHFCWSVGFWMMVFSPSITCCLSWWDSMPAHMEGSQACQITFSKCIPSEIAEFEGCQMFTKHPPSIGEHLNDFAILFHASVTCVFWRKRHNEH